MRQPLRGASAFAAVPDAGFLRRLQPGLRVVSLIAVLVTALAGQSVPASAQRLSALAASGPTFNPGARDVGDWAGLVAVGYYPGPVGGRLDVMYAGLPSSDLLAVTGNLVWRPDRRGSGMVEPYLVAGAGAYLKFLESRFGLNAGVGVRQRIGAVRLMAELRAHRVLRRFEEQPGAATYIPLVVGVSIGD